MRHTSAIIKFIDTAHAEIQFPEFGILVGYFRIAERYYTRRDGGKANGEGGRRLPAASGGGRRGAARRK